MVFRDCVEFVVLGDFGDSGEELSKVTSLVCSTVARSDVIFLLVDHAQFTGLI